MHFLSPFFCRPFSPALFLPPLSPATLSHPFSPPFFDVPAVFSRHFPPPPFLMSHTIKPSIWFFICISASLPPDQ